MAGWSPTSKLQCK